MPHEAILPASVLPESFDARTRWPQCADIIGHVRNQGPCGDCWAFGATQTLQDRFCIHITMHNRNHADLLSVEDVVACMAQQIGTPGQGCAGGSPQNAFVYLNMYGAVSGGDYGETDGKTCLPYQVPPSLDEWEPTTSFPNEVATPKCPGKSNRCADCHCIDAYQKANHSWIEDKRKSGGPYFCKGAGLGRSQCMQSTLLNGPIEASMTVYGDIWSYHSGVYTCQGKGRGGSGHSIVIIGWGLEPGKNKTSPAVPYWLCKNSWGLSWGMNGFFKVTRSGPNGITNDCGKEAEAKMAMPLHVQRRVDS